MHYPPPSWDENNIWHVFGNTPQAGGNAKHYMHVRDWPIASPYAITCSPLPHMHLGCFSKHVVLNETQTNRFLCSVSRTGYGL